MPEANDYYFHLLHSPGKTVDKEIELITLKADVYEFCFNLEMKALHTTGVEKTILDKIINSEDYQKMKSLNK